MDSSLGWAAHRGAAWRGGTEQGREWERGGAERAVRRGGAEEGRLGGGEGKLGFVGERGGEWNGEILGSGMGVGGEDPAYLVGEGWWVPNGSGREVVGNFRGVGGEIGARREILEGNFHQFLEVLRQKNRVFL